jgi:DNA polymerase III delta prime subunit
MFLERLELIPEIVRRVGFTIFALPKSVNMEEIRVPRAIIIQPNEKNSIAIEEVRNIEGLTRTKQASDLIFIIQNAERFTENAANAFLKLLEEPGDNVHFAFLTYDPANFLPTMRSRAHNFVVRDESKMDDPPQIEPKILELAKQLISATPKQLPAVVANIIKDKDDTRGKAVAVVDAAIQLLYKSYFKTGNTKFLDKLDKLLAAQVALGANGHIKLQLIANML